MIDFSTLLDSLINIILMSLGILFFIELESPDRLNHYTVFKKIKLLAYKRIYIHIMISAFTISSLKGTLLCLLHEIGFVEE